MGEADGRACCLQLRRRHPADVQRACRPHVDTPWAGRAERRGQRGGRGEDGGGQRGRGAGAELVDKERAEKRKRERESARERGQKRAQRVAGRAQAGSATGAQEARTSSANAAEHRCSDDRPLQLSQQPAGGRAASRAHCALTAMTFRQVERARDEALQPVLPNVVRLLLVKLLVGVGRRGAVAGRWDLLQLGWREAGHHHRGKAQQHAARGLREQQDGHGGVSSQHDSNEQLCKNSARTSDAWARLDKSVRFPPTPFSRPSLIKPWLPSWRAAAS